MAAVVAVAAMAEGHGYPDQTAALRPGQHTLKLLKLGCLAPTNITGLVECRGKSSRRCRANPLHVNA